MLRDVILLCLLPTLQTLRQPSDDARSPSETVTIECPGLRCAACQLGVLQGPKGVPGVRRVEFDPERARLCVTVEPGFDRHHDLVVAIQRVADPIEMFRARLVDPVQVFLYLDQPLDAERGAAVAAAVKAVPGVKSVFRDERDVLSIAMCATADRADILRRVRSFGFRGEIFETRYGANVESRISEESHHIIGVLILVLSFLTLIDLSAEGKNLGVGLAISRLWIVGGVLVVLFSDLESWPFVRSFGDSLKDKMIVQHKILGAGMVLLGIAEARRRRNKGWRYGPVTLFLVVSLLSGVMLQYHFPVMVDPGHLKAWEWVRRQHLLAAAVGAAALAARAGSEFRWVRWRPFGYAWPLLLGLEGVLLCLFFEPVW